LLATGGSDGIPLAKSFILNALIALLSPKLQEFERVSRKKTLGSKGVQKGLLTQFPM
jgi:hypothetical protein